MSVCFITPYTPLLYTLNVTTSGRNCNTKFDVLTSKMPNTDRSKHAVVCGGLCFNKIGTSKTSSPKGNDRSPDNKQVFLNSSQVSKKNFQLVKGS